MSALVYYLALPFIYLISILPFRLLYLVSDALYIFIFYVLGYRKKVVRKNLRNAFPEKTEQEREIICKKYYRYLCDLFLETFKTLTISKEKMLRHCRLDEESERLFNRLAETDKNIIIVMGHSGNWEWAGNSFSLVCKQQLYVIFHPLSNPYFNKLIINMRTRFGTKLIAMKDTLKDMIRNRNEINATAFIADQAPAPDRAYWMQFLNQDTPVFLGTEKIASKLKYPIVYASVKRLKRGYYVLKAELLPLPSLPGREGEITELHTRKLEQDIIDQPETWLWTHKRWKHSRV